MENEASGGPKVGTVPVKSVRTSATNPRPVSVVVTYTVGEKRTTIPFVNEYGAGR